MNIYSIIEDAKRETNEVNVAFSGGKDAIVLIDLCYKHFKKITAFFLYTVKGLGFQERYLKYIEKKYNLEILRLPHWSISTSYKRSDYKIETITGMSCDVLKPKDVYNYVRNKTGIEWIATGIKIIDSLRRRGTIKHWGNGVDRQSKMMYPIAYFKNSTIFNYIKLNKLYVPHDYNLLRHSGIKNASFGGLMPKELIEVKRKYPEDYEKILDVFPFAEAAVKKEEYASTVSEN